MACLLFTLTASANTSMAIGLWDDDIVSGVARTEYRPDLGTSKNPLFLRYDQAGEEGCKFNSVDALSGCPGRAGLPLNQNGQEVWQGNIHWNAACGGDAQRIDDTWKGCKTYDQSNFRQIGEATDNYWLIIANNDPAFDQCNSGMPGTSLPIVDLASNEPGLFQFHVEKYQVEKQTYRHRFHLAINSRDHDFFCSRLDDYQSSLPFLSVGAQNKAGNSGPVGNIDLWSDYDLHDKISFVYEVEDFLPYSCLEETRQTCNDAYAGSHAGVFMIAEWEGTIRMLFVELWRSEYFAHPVYGPASGKWNWPIDTSVFFPGAEIATLPIGHPAVDDCMLNLEPYTELEVSSRKYFNLNASDLYNCAEELALFSDEIPYGRTDLDGVHWFAESYGTDGLLQVLIDRVNIGTEYVNLALEEKLQSKKPYRKFRQRMQGLDILND